MSVYEKPIDDDFAGTAETIRYMHEMTADAVRDPRVIQMAREIVHHVGHKDYATEAATLLAWCQVNLRYVRDPYHPQGLEHLTHPAILLLESRTGDCDDLSMAFAALCAAIGTPWQFRTFSSSVVPPYRWKHVIPLVLIYGKWVPADPTFPDTPLGWQPTDLDLGYRFGSPNTVTATRDWPYG